MQPSIEGDTDDNRYSTDDKSMGSGTHIPKETGVDNSDAESILIDRKEENEIFGDGCGDKSM